MFVPLRPWAFRREMLEMERGGREGRALWFRAGWVLAIWAPMSEGK